MKNRSVTLSLLTATLFAAPAFAADTPAPDAPPPPPGMGPQGPWREEMLKRFDKNGDGQLDDAERAEARKGREEKRAEMMKKFDRNQDGKLDEDERAAAREAFRKEQGGPGGRPGFHRGPGGEPPEWMRRELHRWFAEQWGGGAGPRHGMHPGAGGPLGPMHKQVMKRFDKDGDGKLNDAERAEVRKAVEEHRALREQRRKDVLARFDANGDGKLDETERKSLKDAWQKFIEQQPVLKPAAK